MTVWSNIDSHTLRVQNDGLSNWSENSALSQREAGKHFKCPEGSCVIILVTGSDINTLISSFSLWRSSWSSGRGFLLCAFRTCSLLFSSLIFFSHWSQVYLKTALKPVSPWLSRLNYRTDPLTHLMHMLCLLGGFGEATQKSVSVLCRLTWREMWDIITGMDWFGSNSLHLSDLLYHFWICSRQRSYCKDWILASTSSVCIPIAEPGKAHSHFLPCLSFLGHPLSLFWCLALANLSPCSPPLRLLPSAWKILGYLLASSHMSRTPQNKTPTPCLTAEVLRPAHRHLLLT